MLLAALLVTAAYVTSAISGMLGMAGGITLLGVMTILLPPQLVVPLHAVVQLSSNFTRTLVFIRHVRWRLVAIFAPPVVLGVAVAARIWSGSELTWFRPAIGLFILAFLAWRRWAPKLRNLPLWSYAIVGAVSGFLTVMVGATGPLIAPFFLRDDLEKEEVIATKAVAQAWGHLWKIPAFIALGFDYRPHLPLVAALIAAVILGTLTGKRLLTRLTRATFERVFEAVLAAIAIYLVAANLRW